MSLLKQLVQIVEARSTGHPLEVIKKDLGDKYSYDLMDDTLVIYTSRTATEDTDPCVEVQYDALDEVLEVSQSAGDQRPDITALYAGSDPAVIAKLQARAAAASGPKNNSPSLTNQKRFKKEMSDDEPFDYDFDYDQITDDISDRLYDLASTMKKFR